MSEKGRGRERDFLKAFDMVRNKLLLHKLEKYGICGQLLQWLEHFLTKRKMRVVVDGEDAHRMLMYSLEYLKELFLVLQCILFLVYINDLPESVLSSVRLFPDDCLLYRVIRNFQDHLILQQDLKNLEEWASMG